VQSCGRLRAALDDPERLRQEAHRLRGTSGSFGLARIAALAGILEQRVARGEGVADIVGELERAAAAAQEQMSAALEPA
ncbi:Hpt domain-containing protein, partial [Priestia endophytica]|uniref:Hpt domain-containing protein n=1 Tax=Priestia endophytica TaxID=135735 RepID=UPI00203B7C9F